MLFKPIFVFAKSSLILYHMLAKWTKELSSKCPIFNIVTIVTPIITFLWEMKALQLLNDPRELCVFHKALLINCFGLSVSTLCFTVSVSWIYLCLYYTFFTSLVAYLNNLYCFTYIPWYMSHSLGVFFSFFICCFFKLCIMVIGFHLTLAHLCS